VPAAVSLSFHHSIRHFFPLTSPAFHSLETTEQVSCLRNLRRLLRVAAHALWFGQHRRLLPPPSVFSPVRLSVSSFLLKRERVRGQRAIHRESLTFRKGREDVVHVLPIGGRGRGVLNSLIPRELLGNFLLNGLIHDIALVSSQNDRRLVPNLMPQLFVPALGFGERILIGDIVDKQGA